MKYLYYIAKQYSIPIITPLVDYLNSREETFSFFVSKKVFKLIPKEWEKHKIYQNLDDAIAYNPDFVIIPGNFVDFRIPGIKVQIFHGLGVEKESHFKIRHFFDVYLTSGPFVTEKYKKLQEKHKYFFVKETGWPKIDYILDYPDENLKKKFGLPENKKVILYAPTFSKKMQSGSQLLPFIVEKIREDEIWIMKFHEFMDKEIVNGFKAQNSENIKIIEDFDITPYLLMADVMISDTSSVIYEFMVLDKPVVTFRTISRFDKGINIERPSELRGAVDRCLENPGEFRERRKRHLNEINPYLDGTISRRIFETLKDIQENNKLPEKKKPLNLVRKFQILYHERFKKGYLR